MKPSILVIAPIEVFGALEELLAPWYELGVALDAGMARSWLNGKTPLLILLDYRMSKLPDGGNVCQELRADGAPTQQVPVILLTAQDDDGTKSLQLDVSDHLTTPFVPQEVKRRVATLVSMRRSQIAENQYRGDLECLAAELEDKNSMLEGLSDKLSKYLAPQVYDSIFSGAQDGSLVTRRKKLTVFFSDIEDFTQTSEDLQPEDLTSLLNSYFTEMSAIAQHYGATIDKFIGDAMLMFFGDPESRGTRDDARACVQMAMAMQRRMADLDGRWRSLGYEKPFRMRIGINTGYCNVGNFGSDDRMDYTIIGSEVNLAARLESQADPGGILMSRETHALVADVVRTDARAPVRVKGIRREIYPYAVSGDFVELERENRIIRKTGNGLNLLIDLETMDENSRKAATIELEEALAAMKQGLGCARQPPDS